MVKHHETSATLWRQIAGASYVWWALAAIVTAGLTVVARAAAPPAPVPDAVLASSVAFASD
jgi:alpha-1,2-mannosyltransferase